MNEKQIEDFQSALNVLALQNQFEMRPPRNEPKVYPVNGIVQPAAMPPPNRKGRFTNLLLKLRTVVNVMLRDKSSLHFRHPVNAVRLGIKEYHTIIHSPMDLNTIKKRLEYSYYWGGADLLEDMRLIFENCRIFNSPDSPVFQSAVTLCELFWLRMEKLQPELHNEIKVEAKPKRQRKTASPMRPAPKPQRQPKAPVKKEPEEKGQRKAAIPTPAFQANQYPDRSQWTQIRPVPTTRRGRGRPPGPRAQAKKYATSSETLVSLPYQNVVKNYGIQVKIESESEIAEPQGSEVDLIPLDREIERTHSKTLLTFLRGRRDAWPFNNAKYWEKFGENSEYDHDEETLDWGILETLLAGRQFEGWDWFLTKIHRMLHNAMSCFALNPSVRTSTQRIHATVERMIPQFVERIADAKERARDAVRLKLEAMTPAQRDDLFK